MRRPKRFLLVLMLVLVLIFLFSVSGCKPGKEKEAVDLLNTMFPESTPTPTPTLTPEPTETPTDTPSPTPEKKLGLHMTNKFWEMFAGLWPVKNKPVSDFGEPYKVYGDYDIQTDSTKLIYAFFPSMSEEEARAYYGQLIFGFELTESFRECKFVGETNSQGDPLDVTFQIVPFENNIEVYITFGTENTKTFIDQVFDAYWPDNTVVNKSLKEMDPLFRGFTYESQSGDTLGIYNIWNPDAVKMESIRLAFQSDFGGLPDFSESENTRTFTPRLSFTYDIMGDGKNKLSIYSCPVFVDFYEDSGLLKLAIGAD